MMRLWDAWSASGCSKSCAQEYGLDLRGMNFARDIRRQLESERGVAPEHNATCPTSPEHSSRHPQQQALRGVVIPKLITSSSIVSLLPPLPDSSILP